MINFLNLLIGIALLCAVSAVITLSYYNWNAEIQKSLIWSGVILVGSLLATLYPIFSALKEFKQEPKHINTWLVRPDSANHQISPNVLNIQDKRFYDYQLIWNEQKPGHSLQRTETDMTNIYGEIVMSDILRSIIFYINAGKNGSAETEPSGNEMVFHYILNPVDSSKKEMITDLKFNSEYIPYSVIKKYLHNGVELPAGTSVVFDKIKYNDFLKLPVIVIEKPHYFKLTITLTPGSGEMNGQFTNGDGSKINAVNSSFLIDVYASFSAISSKHRLRDHYIRWVSDITGMIEKRYGDTSSFSFK